MLLDFSSDILTLKSAPIPISLFSFFAFLPSNITTIPLTSSFSQLSDLLSQKYDYTEEVEMNANMNIFKKGLFKDIQKFFCNLVQHTENLYVGEFTLEDLTDEYALLLLIRDEMKVQITLCGKQYQNF